MTQEEFRFWQTASGSFLCENVPDEWLDMSTEEQDEFLVDNAWEPLEYRTAEQLRDLIDATHHVFWRLHSEIVLGLV